MTDEEIFSYSFQEIIFLGLPFEHAENLDCQNRSVKIYESLLDKYKDNESLLEILQKLLEYAHDHKENVDRFGRFPHRNEVLGRESTADEIEFLEHAPRYGQ